MNRRNILQSQNLDSDNPLGCFDRISFYFKRANTAIKYCFRGRGTVEGFRRILLRTIHENGSTDSSSSDNSGGIPDSQPLLFTDVNGTIKSKHFIMISEFIKEKCKEGLISLMKCPTDKNKANIMTKIVIGKESHQSIADILGTPV